MLHLMGAPRPTPSLPFSDWKARVERVIQRRTGHCVTLRAEDGLRAYFLSGISPLEAAEDWVASC